jgi:hypothetical protein
MSTDNNVPMINPDKYTSYSIRPVLYMGEDTESFDSLMQLGNRSPSVWGLYGRASKGLRMHIADFPTYHDAAHAYACLTGNPVPAAAEARHDLPARAAPRVVVKVEGGVVQTGWSTIDGTDITVIDLDNAEGLNLNNYFAEIGLGSATEFESSIASGALVPVF